MRRRKKQSLLQICSDSIRRYWLWTVLFLLLLVAIVGIAVVLIRRARGETWTDCGETPDEARSRGCSFDMLSHAWQTKECYDGEISSAYRKAGRWQYYLDRYGKYPIAEHIVARGDTDVWLKEHQHYIHCIYMWRQMHRAFTVLHHIDSHLDNYNHTMHCGKIFSENRDGDLLEVLGRVIYPSCRSV